MSSPTKGSGWAVWVGAGLALTLVAVGIVALVTQLDLGPGPEPAELMAPAQPPPEEATAPRAIAQRWRPAAPPPVASPPAVEAPPAEPDESDADREYQEVHERVREQAQAYVDARRERAVARCGPSSRETTVTLQLQFGADGRELARGGSGRRNQDASAEACIRQALSDPVLVEPPGRPITVNVVSGPVESAGPSRVAE